MSYVRKLIDWRTKILSSKKKIISWLLPVFSYVTYWRIYLPFFLICFVLCKHLNCWFSNMKKHEGNKNCNTFSNFNRSGLCNVDKNNGNAVRSGNCSNSEPKVCSTDFDSWNTVRCYNLKKWASLKYFDTWSIANRAIRQNCGAGASTELYNSGWSLYRVDSHYSMKSILLPGQMFIFA